MAKITTFHKWAFNHSSPSAQLRYLTYGTPLTFSDDHSIAYGISWLFSSLTSSPVSSPSYITEIDVPIEPWAGDHWCKVLSPFRAMEWIYVDSLYA